MLIHTYMHLCLESVGVKGFSGEKSVTVEYATKRKEGEVLVALCSERRRGQGRRGYMVADT